MESLLLIPLIALPWIATAWVAYLVIKAAVRNGILEADVRRGKAIRQQQAAALRRELEAEGVVSGGQVVAGATAATRAGGAPDPL